MLMDEFMSPYLRMTVLVPPDEDLLNLLRAHAAGKLVTADLHRILELHFLSEDYTVDDLLQLSSSKLH
jgi:hypothetical protein